MRHRFPQDAATNVEAATAEEQKRREEEYAEIRISNGGGWMLFPRCWPFALPFFFFLAPKSVGKLQPLSSQ